MRVLMQHSDFPPAVGGGPTRFFHLARALADLGHEVVVFTPETDDPSHLDDWPGFRVVRYPGFVNRLGRLRYWRSLWLPLRKYRYYRSVLERLPEGRWDFIYTAVPDFVVHLRRRFPRQLIIYAPGYTPLAVRREKFAGAERVLSLWGFRQRMNYRQMVWIERRATRKADVVLVQSEMMVEMFRRGHGVPADKLHLLRHGADLKRFRPGRPREALRGRLGLPRGVFLVCFVGNLNNEKNVPYLLRALACPGAEGAHLVIVGAGPEGDSLRALAERLGVRGRVVFAGSRRNVEDYLSAADLFVLPSTSEAFGLALAEAMASGLPCIALRPEFGRINSGAAELIDHGVSGFLVDPDDPADLAARISFLAGNPGEARRMGEAARRKAEREFDWTTIARRLLAIVGRVRGGAG